MRTRNFPDSNFPEISVGFPRCFMNTPTDSFDPLFEVEQKIARRADELDRSLGIDPQHALEHWRQAEQEVWHDFADADEVTSR
jgi:hypothetical protein